MAKKDYAPKPLMRPMSDEELARAHDRQKVFSLTGSALGVGGLSLLGAAAVKGKRNPIKAAKLKDYATNTSITAGGIGALSGINFARIQGEESRRQREIKKSNYGSGYSQFYVEDKKKVPFTISPKAHDPEASRERRAATYPAVMGAGAVGTGALTVREAMKKTPKKEKVKIKTKAGKKVKKLPIRDIDTKILNNKAVRVGAGTAATAGLAYGAIYNAQKKNRTGYGDRWYPDYER